MAAVFISYAREDQEIAQELARRLLQHGWSVWWDRDLVAGNHFDEVIERELTEAKAVVVLWSDSSARSHWVRSEAGAALDRGALVPVLVSSATVPLQFRNLQAVNLIGWDRRTDDPQLERLYVGVRELAGVPAPPGRPLAPPTVPHEVPPADQASPPEHVDEPASQTKPAPPPIYVDPSTDPAADEGRRRRRWRLVVASMAVLVTIAAAVGLVVLLTDQGDDGGSAESATTISSTTSGTNSSSTSTGTTSTLPSPTDRLDAGAKLSAGEQIATPDGRHTLTMTDDGVLLGATDGETFWKPYRVGRPGAVAIMQGDGNFVVYPSSELSPPELWQSGTSGHSGEGAYLVISDVGGRGWIAIKTANGDTFVLADDQPHPSGGTDTTSATTSATTDGSTSSTSSSLAPNAVPNVVGFKERMAIDFLYERGFVPEPSYQDVQPGSPEAGFVISQDPGANTEVGQGSTVRIIVGRER